jgi:hypothetical protein
VSYCCRRSGSMYLTLPERECDALSVVEAEIQALVQHVSVGFPKSLIKRQHCAEGDPLEAVCKKSNS